jgi:hypothetical protein
MLNTSKSFSNLSVNEFFYAIEETDIANIEILNFTEKLTDNFRIDKLKVLLNEFEMHLSLRKEDKESEFSKDDIANAISELTDKGKEIPYLKFSESAKKLFNVSENIIDLEKLLFPYDLFRLYQFRNLLNSKIKEVQSSNPANVPTANINESFNTILTPEKATFILNMLEDLSITSNGISILGVRKKSALRGVVEACLEKNILPHQSIDKLCSLIAARINLELKAKLDYSDTAKSFQKQSIAYIEKHYNN